jgi:1-deoxy-D-xylulose-5-phosphate synthase
MTVLAPSSFAELEEMLERAVWKLRGPVAVRYPRGGEGAYTGVSGTDPAVVLRPGRDITFVGYGMQINDLLEAAQRLSAQGVEAEVVKLNTITPLPAEDILESVKRTGALLTAEDCVASGSVGERLSAALAQSGVVAKVCCIDCGDRFVTHGSLKQLKKELCLDGEGIARRALEVLGHG